MNTTLDELIWRKIASEASLLVHAVIVADTGASGKILYTSGLADKMFGYDSKELVGKSIDILLPEDSRDRHKEYRKEFAVHPRARPMGHGMVLFGQRKDNTTFPVQISLSPINVLNKNAVVAFVIDLTGAVNTATRVLQHGSDSGIINKPNDINNNPGGN